MSGPALTTTKDCANNPYPGYNFVFTIPYSRSFTFRRFHFRSYILNTCMLRVPKCFRTLGITSLKLPTDWRSYERVVRDLFLQHEWWPVFTFWHNELSNVIRRVFSFYACMCLVVVVLNAETGRRTIPWFYHIDIQMHYQELIKPFI